MKLLTVIIDATGTLHIEATRAPDLRRREISAQTGAAEILFCATPLHRKSSDTLATELVKVFRAQSEEPYATLSRARIIRRALWHVYFKPPLARIGKKMRKHLLSCARFPNRTMIRA